MHRTEAPGNGCQEIEIYLNFIGKFEVPMPEPDRGRIGCGGKRRQKRIRDHEKLSAPERAQTEIAEGLIVPTELICAHAAGEPFQSIRPNAKFCKPACREKFYRQQKRAAKQEKDTSPAGANGG